LTTLGVLTFGEIDQEYDKYYGVITADIRRAKMIELYNDNNIKVYVDDERYILGDVSDPRYLKITTPLTDSNYLSIFLDKPYIAGCTIIIKGNTVTIDGTSNSSKFALYVELNGYHLKVKGNLVIRAYNGNEEELVTTTLYDEAQVVQYTVDGGYNKVDYILHDKSLLIGQGPLKAYLYDNSICTLNNGEAEVYAYDSSKVTINSTDIKVIVNAYDNSKVEARKSVDVVINDESKLVRF